MDSFDLILHSGTVFLITLLKNHVFALVLILCCFFLLTCSSFSAVGLFFGFLVRASLTKWWKLFVLLVQNWEKKKRKNELNI